MTDSHKTSTSGRVRKIVVAPVPLSLVDDPLLTNTPQSARNNIPNSGRAAMTRGTSAKGSGLLQRSESKKRLDDSSSRAPATGRRGSFEPPSSARRGSFQFEPPSSARRGSFQFESSEAAALSVEREGNMTCCNMKLSDLKSESLKFNCYNSFEVGIIDARRKMREKNPGRSIQSIRSNPSASTMSLSGLMKMGAATLEGLTMITDNLLLGGREEAENAGLLLDMGVTHVLNTAQQLPCYFPQQFVYLKIGLIDATNASVVDVADSVVSFLSHVENVKGRVLVHCLAGVSRSVSVLLLHLIVRHRLPLLDAFRYMRSCRSQVNPNTAFKLQLARLEVQELRYSSIAKDGDKAWDFYEWNSIKRSMPSKRPDEDEGERYLSSEDALSRSRGGGGGSSSGHGGRGLLPQLSSSSMHDGDGCCAIS